MKKLSMIVCIISVGLGLNAENIKTEQINLVDKIKKSIITPSLAVKKNNKQKIQGFYLKKANIQTDQIILKVAPGSDIKNKLVELKNFLNIKAKKVHSFILKKPGISAKASPKMVIIKVSDKSKLKEVIQYFKNQNGVLEAKPDFVVKAFGIPNDPMYDGQWDMDKINAPAAWDVSHGSDSVAVGVVDTGIDYTQSELKKNIWVNEKELNGKPGVDDDGDGYVDDIYGIDTYNHDSDPMDDEGHGTHVAGTIGAVGNNKLGIAGINWNIKLIACKFIGKDGYGYTSGAIECMNYLNSLKEKNVNIVAINNSWGGGEYDSDLYDVMKTSGDLNIIDVCAAGNESNDNDENPTYPASYDLPNIISVAATDQDDNLAWFSNYGQTSVDLAAPGVDILSTIPSLHKCQRKKNIVGIGFENANSVKGWEFLSVDWESPIKDLPEYHWHRDNNDSFAGSWSLSNNIDENVTSKEFVIQSAVTKRFDLSEYNSTDNNQCVGITLRDKVNNAEYLPDLGILISGDNGYNWQTYSWSYTHPDENWTIKGGNVVPVELLTKSSRIAIVSFASSEYNLSHHYIDNMVLYKGAIKSIPQYAFYSGTSMAAPHVSGAIALAASIYPDENLTERVNRILDGVDYIPDLDGKVATSGRLNLMRVLDGSKNINGNDFNITVNNNWKHIDTEFNFTPVIIASPVAFNGPDGAVVRLKDINSSGFDIKVQEWNYLDGKHGKENIFVSAVKPGRYLMPDGGVMEIGTFKANGTTKWWHVNFEQPFADKPHLFLTVQTFNGPDTVVIRARNVSAEGFDAKLFEQEKNMGSGHATETIGYLAIYSPNDNLCIPDGPCFDFQTISVNSKWTDTGYGYDLLLQEEKSKDSETTHCYEDIDILSSDNGFIFAQDVSTKGKDPISIRYRRHK
jgi:subtilisin family serine protease